jgi:hypothetical protein
VSSVRCLRLKRDYQTRSVALCASSQNTFWTSWPYRVDSISTPSQSARRNACPMKRDDSWPPPQNEFPLSFNRNMKSQCHAQQLSLTGGRRTSNLHIKRLWISNQQPDTSSLSQNRIFSYPLSHSLNHANLHYGLPLCYLWSCRRRPLRNCEIYFQPAWYLLRI